MKVLLTGSSGLVGSRLQQLLPGWGHEVVPCRHRVASGQTTFDVPGPADAVVHLAGANVAGGRWTAARRRLIHDSRSEGTAALVASLLAQEQLPRVFIGASAMGLYGDRGEEELFEDSPAGEGFLPEVVEAWEAAAEPLREAGVRVMHLRIGLVLSKGGGALQRMLLPFKLGLGGRLGSGRQWVSWVHLDDLCGMVRAGLDNPDMQGPYHAVAPEPVRNLAFTKALGRVLRRPTILPVPAFALRLALGELADALLLASIRVLPRRLTEQGHRWEHPELEAALRDCLRS